MLKAKKRQWNSPNSLFTERVLMASRIEFWRDSKKKNFTKEPTKERKLCRATIIDEEQEAKLE